MLWSHMVRPSPRFLALGDTLFYAGSMPLLESSTGTLSALEWKTYSVSRKGKEPLLRFIVEALEIRGCRIVHATDPGQAPFYIVFETSSGDRHGLLAYAFFANAKTTRNRPADEHRFQIKYGGNLKGVLEVSVDPHELITAIFLGIDPDRGIFVAADPLMNTPAPMSRSVEYKKQHVDQVLEEGWAAWERERREGRTRDRPSYELDKDIRTEVLIGGRKERLLDLIILERIARGLDPGERHLVAHKLKEKQAVDRAKARTHSLMEELEIEPEALFDLIEGASRLKMAVRGWVAETHLETLLRELPGVTDCERLDAEGRPDISLRWKGGSPILIECKNTLRTCYADGRPKVDFQRTRASKGDPCSRYYASSDFPILAACLHAVTEAWEFQFALTSDLPAHKKCEGRITNTIAVDEPVFTKDPESVFDKHSGLLI